MILRGDIYTTVSNIICRLALLVALLLAHGARAESVLKGDNFIMHHVKDAHEWHFATVGHTRVTLPLPVIIYATDRGLEIFSSSRFSDACHQRIPYAGYALDDNDKIVALDRDRIFYDLSITKNVAAMLVSVVMLLATFLSAARHYTRKPKAVPSGFWAFLELLICFVRDEIALPNIGQKDHRRFMPYLLSIFFFIWLNNLLGLLPGGANVTGNISITLVLALFTFVMTNLNGNKYYWNHVFNTPGVPWWLSPIMVPVELLGLFTKPFALMIRLFANITAGHIILLSIVG